MFVKRRFIRIMLILLSTLLIVSVNISCIRIVRQATPEPSQGQLPSEGQSAGPTRPHPPVRTGEISLGQKVDITSQSIGVSGGIIAVTKPGDPLDGFVISVSPQSYADSRIFKISSASINYQAFGSDIHPISPMISVDNGGGYADEVMYVRVPVKVPEGYFAMGFMYDGTTKQLAGMPLVGSDAESVTVATMHFSNFFISMIEKALLKNDVDSGFQPGIDDWQFENTGSYIVPKGHCEGQALTALWYYCTQPDGKDLCLYGRYDNNGNKPATPDLWQDDSLGYRFCSVIQKEKKVGFSKDFWENLGGKNWELKNNKWELKDVPGIGDEAIFNLFAYSIRATGEPQEVVIWSKAGGGHAMIVYKSIGNALYIADPNYPGNTDRKIIFYSGEGKFKPYNSGANRKEIDAGKGTAYDSILYVGKSTLISWDTIAQRWGEFKNKTIGNDKFPGYQIKYKDEEGKLQDLLDGYVSPVKLIRIGPSSAGLGIIGYRDGSELQFDDQGRYELNPGKNLLGIYVVGDTNNDPNNSSWEYVDFKYITVYLGGLSIDPPSLEGVANTEYTFTAKTLSPPARARYEWAVDGAVQATTGNVLKYKLGNNPSYTITCKLFDAATNKEIGNATAVVTTTKASDVWVKIDYCERKSGNTVHISLEVYDRVTHLDPKCDGGSKIRCVWHWGDGSTSETTYPHADHQYSSGGKYTISVQYMCPGGPKIYAQDSRNIILNDQGCYFE